MIALTPHPSSPESAWTVSAAAERTAGNDLCLRYLVTGALEGLSVPFPGAVRRGDRLWEHTCAEAFVKAEGASAYVELNFSPSQEWAAYAFTAYREGGPLPACRLPPRVDVRREPDTLVLEARVALHDLSSAYAGAAALRVGLSMVTETAGGQCAYWALHHPRAQPDFHHADAFALRLEASA